LSHIGAADLAINLPRLRNLSLQGNQLDQLQNLDALASHLTDAPTSRRGLRYLNELILSGNPVQTAVASDPAARIAYRECAAGPV
jgi:Leucine-rich repeat (LRR) protein